MIFKKNSEEASVQKSKLGKHKTRGTNDEMEIIKLVLLENKTLFMKVYDRVKVMKSQAEAFKANAEKSKKSDSA